MNKIVRFISFDKVNDQIKNKLIDSFKNFIDNQNYVLGKKVSDFEKQYARFNKVNYCIGVGNGLDAIVIALRVLGIGKGDEVLVPSNTFIATWLAVSSVGAIPVPVEPKIDTYNIDPNCITKKITNKTKAIIPVHLYGQACEMDKIMEIAKINKLFVIEDNAQAQGATYGNQMTGSFGEINATSFYPGKNIGAFGDAGAITTKNKKFAESTKMLRNYGSEIKYLNKIKGLNSRLDEIQAGFLSIKLSYLRRWNKDRQRVAKIYSHDLAGVGDLILPRIAAGATTVYHQYVVCTHKRDTLQKFLFQKKIKTMIHYPIPPHLQQAYSEFGYKRGDYPIAERLSETTLSLPIYPYLDMTEQSYIINCIRKFFDEK